jgi:hypothetical protein
MDRFASLAIKSPQFVLWFQELANINRGSFGRQRQRRTKALKRFERFSYCLLSTTHQPHRKLTTRALWSLAHNVSRAFIRRLTSSHLHALRSTRPISCIAGCDAACALTAEAAERDAFGRRSGGSARQSKHLQPRGRQRPEHAKSHTFQRMRILRRMMCCRDSMAPVHHVDALDR